MGFMLVVFLCFNFLTNHRNEYKYDLLQVLSVPDL